MKMHSFSSKMIANTAAARRIFRCKELAAACDYGTPWTFHLNVLHVFCVNKLTELENRLASQTIMRFLEQYRSSR